jgi:hypothetical protein
LTTELATSRFIKESAIKERVALSRVYEPTNILSNK